MPQNQRLNLDSTDNVILHHLQLDGRISIADLARTISMSPTSVADRVRRLSDHGVIEGYAAIVSAEALGYPLTAFIRLRLTVGTGNPFREFLDRAPQVLEAHHLAGEDCFLLKVIASSMPDLEALTNGLVTFGHVTTNLVFSSPVDRHPMPPSAI
ncbi:MULTISPECIES: Lrp/AsnC family transcriptional regulator [unclassified Mycobacterium]|uniref:Lrp/AsnC family transcriptional regulator n=1 Tax=unclassified Mycobacterium TaxID=2642494 RepID=UPI0029C7CD8C|nr:MULTISPECIES: Lrp/AsnC family transcriptional regulator [unclassified Mycobacterium]